MASSSRVKKTDLSPLVTVKSSIRSLRNFATTARAVRKRKKSLSPDSSIHKRGKSVLDKNEEMAGSSSSSELTSCTTPESSTSNSTNSEPESEIEEIRLEDSDAQDSDLYMVPVTPEGSEDDLDPKFITPEKRRSGDPDYPTKPTKPKISSVRNKSGKRTSLFQTETDSLSSSPDNTRKTSTPILGSNEPKLSLDVSSIPQSEDAISVDPIPPSNQQLTPKTRRKILEESPSNYPICSISTLKLRGRLPSDMQIVRNDIQFLNNVNRN